MTTRPSRTNKLDLGDLIVLYKGNDSDYRTISVPDFMDKVKDEISDGVLTWSGRTQEDKNKDMITPLDFKAKGDGITDDTQAFINLELEYSGLIVDLLGKTYMVDAIPPYNTYINGYFSIPSGENRSLVKSEKSDYVNSHYLQNSDGGYLVKSLKTTAATETGSRILQSMAYDFKTKNLFAIKESKTTAEGEVVIETYNLANLQTDVVASAISTPNTSIGHQGFGIQTVRNNTRFFWATSGIAQSDARKFVRFKFNSNIVSELVDFTLFGSNFNQVNATKTIAVSPDGKTIAAFGVRASDSMRVIRIFDAHIFAYSNGGDFSEQYMFEFTMARPYGWIFAGLATDSKFVYFLGSNVVSTQDLVTAEVARQHVQVYTLDGKLVINDQYCRIGLGTALAQGSVSSDLTYMYEPEAFGWIGDQNSPNLVVLGASSTTTDGIYRYNNIHSITDMKRNILSADDLVSNNINSFSKTINLKANDGQIMSAFTVDGSGNVIAKLLNSGSAATYYEVSNNKRRISLQVNATGGFGLYDHTLGRWLITSDTSGSVIINHATNVIEKTGPGSPEGVLTAGVGSRYFRTDGGAGTTFYVKESGTGSTGWVAK